MKNFIYFFIPKIYFFHSINARNVFTISATSLYNIFFTFYYYYILRLYKRSPSTYRRSKPFSVTLKNYCASFYFLFFLSANFFLSLTYHLCMVSFNSLHNFGNEQESLKEAAEQITRERKMTTINREIKEVNTDEKLKSAWGIKTVNLRTRDKTEDPAKEEDEC